MKGFEKGKLALITGAYTDVGRKDVGKVVTLESFVPKGYIQEFNGRFFHAENDNGWIISGDITASSGLRGLSIKGVKHLMPLEDPDQFVKENDKELENV